MVQEGGNPSQGVRAKAAVRGNSGGSPVRLVQPRSAWGAFDLATGGADSLTGVGDPGKAGP